jgi:hypothetical protein
LAHIDHPLYDFTGNTKSEVALNTRRDRTGERSFRRSGLFRLCYPHQWCNYPWVCGFGFPLGCLETEENSDDGCRRSRHAHKSQDMFAFHFEFSS